MKCSNGHKPPVKARWVVGPAVLCNDCLRRAKDQKVSMAFKERLISSIRKDEARAKKKDA